MISREIGAFRGAGSPSRPAGSRHGMGSGMSYLDLRSLKMVTWALFLVGCGGAVVDTEGAGGQAGTTTTSAAVTFACGEDTCSAKTEYCRDRLPLQPPPVGDGSEVIECLPLPDECNGVPSCSCVPQLGTCDVIDCTVGDGGAVTVLCKESL